MIWHDTGFSLHCVSELTKWHSDNPGAQIQIEREFYEMFSWLVTYNTAPHYLMRLSCRNSSGYKGSDNVIRIIDTEQARSKWINNPVLNWLWLPTSVHLITYQLYPITINQNKLSTDWDGKKKTRMKGWKEEYQKRIMILVVFLTCMMILG